MIAESLERRQFLSVSTDANGYTVVAPPRDAHVIYVSSSAGDDDNSGSANSPVRSLREAASRVRDDSGDQMLLKRGDVWRESFGQWRKGGESAAEPIVIGAYGEGDRPRLDTGAETGILLGAWSDVRHVVVQGIAFNADARDPASPRFNEDASKAAAVGIHVTNGTADILIEDCLVRGYSTNITAMNNAAGDVRDLTVRRSVIVDAYSATDRHSQGLYAEGVKRLTLEGNVFDHNGWNEVVPGARATMYNHNIYLAAENSGVVVRGNLIARASGHGLQARGGGTVEENVFLNNPTAMSYGLVRGQRDPAAKGVSGIVNGNLFLGTSDIDGAKRGTAIEIANTAPGVPTVLSNNIFSHDNRAGGGYPAISLVYPDGEGGVGLNDLTVQGNVVYKWTAGLYVQQDIEPGGTGRLALNRLAVRDNDFVRIEGGQVIRHDGKLDAGQERWDGNRYDGAGSENSWVRVEWRGRNFDDWTDDYDVAGRASRPTYAGAERDAGAYNATLGGDDSVAAFIEAAKLQSRQAYRAEYAPAALLQYVREGFAETNRATPRSWLAPTAPAAVAEVPNMAVTTADASIEFAVTYADDKALDLASLGDGDVRLVSRDREGVSFAATLVNVNDPAGDGSGQVTATYRVNAPAGTWRRGDAGRYRIVVQREEVRDTVGFAMEPRAIGQFALGVTKAPDPPRVAKVKWKAGKGPHGLTVKFTADVSATLRAEALELAAEDGTLIDPAMMSMTWDAKSKAATWTFPGLDRGALPAGRYRFAIAAQGLADSGGRLLDGNKDGVGGDDYLHPKLFRVKG